MVEQKQPNAFCPESLFTLIAIPTREDFSDFGESLPLRLRPALHALAVSRNHPPVLKTLRIEILALPQKGMDGEPPRRVLQFMVNMNCQRGCEAENGIDTPAPEVSCAYE